MTFKEKEQLQKLVEELPSENLGRVAEIVIQHRTDETDLADEIHIDLDKEVSETAHINAWNSNHRLNHSVYMCLFILQNNTTLWRLYYYVEAVEKAKKLASG